VWLGDASVETGASVTADTAGRRFQVPCRNRECGLSLVASEAQELLGHSAAGVGVRFTCGECEIEQVQLLSSIGFAALMMDLQVMGWVGDDGVIRWGGPDAAVSTAAKDTPVDVLSPSELLGREVQGGRIELDAVEDLGDILLLWDYQEQMFPDTVARERLSGSK
jgi:hypothetical protein